MKKIGIVTINDYDNYGNRLQNYATQEVLKKMGYSPLTLKNHNILNTKNKFIIRIPKFVILRLKEILKYNRKRYKKFKNFNSYIDKTKFWITPYSKINDKYDFFVVGSDQVWKPTYGRMRDVDFLCFAKPEKRIAYSASFGIDELPDEKKEFAKKYLNSFKKISVREESGRRIVEELTSRKDVELLIDPTMMLNANEWDKVSKKPEQLCNEKYILNYFLGTISESRKREIERIAKKYDCKIINILDRNDPFYETGPSEFLYLEKNAFLICTDSFHASVFSIIYNRPFIVFEREDNKVNMNSRIETLLTKFKLEKHRFVDRIEDSVFMENYAEAEEVLKYEKTKAEKFLKDSLK